MPLPCGCEIKPGKKVDPEMLKKHHQHTLSAMLFWELLIRSGVTQDYSPDSLATKRAEYLKALGKSFPEVI